MRRDIRSRSRSHPHPSARARQSAAVSRSRSVFLDSETDVTPATPFVMRGALLIAAAGFFVVRIGLGYEFWKRGVHLHVMRHEQSATAQTRPKLAELPEHVAVAVGAVVQEHV